MEHIWHNARKNLKIAIDNQLAFKKCNTDDEKYLAYQIIEKNRSAKGFPLKMTWEQILETTKIIESDFFLLSDQENIPIASSIIFKSNSNIMQVIYWGDIPEYSNLKAMNYLAFKISEYYKKSPIHYIDIGPSTNNSIPNFGLCEFQRKYWMRNSIKSIIH